MRGGSSADSSKSLFVVVAVFSVAWSLAVGAVLFIFPQWVDHYRLSLKGRCGRWGKVHAVKWPWVLDMMGHLMGPVIDYFPITVRRDTGTAFNAFRPQGLQPRWATNT